MHMNEGSLRKLDAVRAAARDPEASYLLRTRLRRFILSVLRSVAEDEGVEAPALPVPFECPSAASGRSIAILKVCNSLEHEIRSLCQRSEPLDQRWKAGWGVVEQHLEKLERLLRTPRYDAGA